MLYSDFQNESTPILVWRFEDAPKALRELSNNGGDEDWVALVPVFLADADTYIGWIEGSGFGCCDVEQHKLEDGSIVYIGAHA